MEYSKANGTRVRLILTEEELGVPKIDEICLKFKEWVAECRGRKTRSANRKADQLLEEIMSFQLPPIEINVTTLSPPSPPVSQLTDTSCDSDSAYSSSLRPKTRQSAKRKVTTPSTPAHQRIRSHMKQPTSGSAQNVLSAALDQKHPSVSVSKIRQLLNAGSAQKKRDEEKERHERLMLDRKAKEERAEAQKKQLLEQRAVTAKLKREQRLLHAAEVRKEREEARRKLKLVEDTKKAQVQTQPQPEAQLPQKPQAHKEKVKEPPRVLNETFKKPLEEIDNIEILISDESTADKKEKVQQYAGWTRAPHFRDALIRQFSSSTQDLLEQFKNEIPPESLPEGPVDLAKILGPKSLGNKCLVRTSSAVWSPVHKPLKRTGSNINQQ